MSADKTRYIKIVKITYGDIQKNTVEQKINSAVNVIRENGGKVISFMHELIGIGFSTVYLVYTIIYEATSEIPISVFGSDDDNDNMM